MNSARDDMEMAQNGASFSGQRRASLFEAAESQAPSLDMVNYGLASPLKDPATFSYDDPILYQSLGGNGAQNENSAFVNGHGGASADANSSPNWNNWNNLNGQWAMPGALGPVSEDAMDLDSSPFMPTVSYAAPPALAAENRGEAGVGHVTSYERFQFVASDGARDGGDSFALLPAGHTPHADPPASYVSEDISPASNTYFPAESASLGGPLAADDGSVYRSAAEFAALDARHNSSQNSYANGATNGPNGVPEDAYMYPTEPLSLDLPECRDSGSHRTSLSAAINDLSPWTTTTSFTPSATSLHSAQPSYFSAQQFMRSSMEQPPAPLGRGSLDYYSRRRPSMESVGSGPHVAARSQRSLSSYFHFRDRDRKSPMSRGHSPEWASPPPLSQPRHSIRRIFKTSNGHSGAGEVESYAGENDLENAYMGSAINQQLHSSMGQDDTPYDDAKKKRKRHLFTRFKATRSNDEAKPESEDVSEGDLTKNLAQNGPQNGPQSRGNASLKNVDSKGSAHDTQEPDYAALFAGVGKRRNLVSMKSKKKEPVARPEPDIKMEDDTDKLAVNVSLSSNDLSGASGDCVSACSVSHSQHSFTSKESTTQDSSSGPSAFANASKRILGSRLMKKKNVGRSEPAPSDVVEVDLQSLDLPQNTEILSNPQLINKTRGRKEDKAADMEDQSKIFVCGYCDRRFKRQEHLKRHFRSLHTSEKPYDCPICSKKFSRTDNLNQHLKVHKQEEEEAAALRSGE